LYHFQQKEKFLSFNEEVLRDYVEHGTVEEAERVKLLFEPRIEAEIYRTIPDSFARLRGKLNVPAAYIGGKFSREARMARLGFMQKHFPIDFYFIEGSHLFPFETPAEAAHAINRAITNLKISH
jgi:hypothetical protein